ncbi:FtsX-like permease family protein [Candidatus Competibacter phosphatis]|uniref:FtsX-like permease family protein n=1 Tax=Candidatus Competibacter phosphatis TaxID=221280 RepID=A0ABX1TM96_9GAMM|nr:ABC transporter permease [Candidatus Competibacter phosphatis]NMQ19020.1 FtsX-like permease family protein [Candidatus Competibacter phosphatis]
MFWSSVLLALRAIRRNLLRSFLTILGIVIGVGAVITMVTLGNGATRAVSDQISSLGSNLIMVRPGQRLGPGRDSAGAPRFKASDAEAIAAQISSINAVAPVANKSVTVVYAARNWSTTVTGSTDAYFTVGNWQLADGRVFTKAEQRAGKAVCVIGATVRKELFGDRPPLGDELRIKNFACEVIGLLQSKGQSAMGMDQDDIIVIPLRTLQRRLAGNQDVNTLMVSAQDSGDTDRIMADLRLLMRERRKIVANEDDNFSILDTRQIAEAMTGTTKVLTMLLGAVAAVSLLVGGIGIMNIMLVSVTERTREIGIRLAIGALEREVLLQFLIEAVALSSLGGVVGITLATLASLGLAKIMQVPYVFDPGINLLSFLFSAAIGVIFGYFPARRAARLDPIDALRHE